MSNMERNKGKLIPTGKTLEQLVEELNVAVPKYYDSKLEYILDYMEEIGFVELKDTIYRVEFEVHGDDDIVMADVNENSDGVIDFHTIHYNGGAHWSEVVEDELKKQRKKVYYAT